MADVKSITYEKMYEENYSIVFEYICRAVHNSFTDREDLIQEVFWVAFQKWELIRTYDNIQRFLLRVARYKVLKYYARRKEICIGDLKIFDLLSDETSKKDDELDMVEMIVSLERNIAREKIKTLRLYYEYGYTAAEMAKQMHIGESGVKMRIARIKNKIRKVMNWGLSLFIIYIIRSSVCIYKR